jgi:uncharacterized protein YeaO (DUF488 family)
MIKTKRWDDPREDGDGFRLLITRYQPRGVPKAQQSWDEWRLDLGPSKELHAALFPKTGRMRISWDVYRARYLREMLSQKEVIAQLARRALAGETITLLCSSGCVRESQCHRSLLKELIEAEMQRLKPAAGAATPSSPTATG